MLELHVALIHHPVFDRNKSVVATTITHFDVHDIARVCRSYGVTKYHIVHPSEGQLMFVERLKEHWTLGFGKAFNPLRAEAIKIIQTSESLKKLKEEVQFDSVLATSAKNHEGFNNVSFQDLKNEILENKNPENLKKILILFGTGSGLTRAIFEQCDGILEPIIGFEGSDFRHLSVRSAVAIVLDRLHRS